MSRDNNKNEIEKKNCHSDYATIQIKLDKQRDNDDNDDNEDNSCFYSSRM